jgi:hypothetical protein
MARPVPTLDYERELMATGARIIAGMDEVGRGAIAGPVTIGVVAIDATIGAVIPSSRQISLIAFFSPLSSVIFQTPELSQCQVLLLAYIRLSLPK